MMLVALTFPSAFLVPATAMKSPTLSAAELDAAELDAAAMVRNVVAEL